MTGYRRIGVFGATGRVGRESKFEARLFGGRSFINNAKSVTRALAESGFEVVPFSRQKTVCVHTPALEA